MKRIIVIFLLFVFSTMLVLGGCSAPAATPPSPSSAASSSASVSSEAAVPALASTEASSGTATSGEFVIGLECTYPPYNWTQNDNSNGAVEINGGGGFAGGYDIEMAKLIAAGLNKKLVVKKIEWNGLVPACQSGIIDAIIAGMSPTAEKKQAINFTETYCQVSMGIVVKKGSKFESAKSISDFAGAKLTAQLNTFHYPLIDQIKDVQKQTAMDDFPAMRVALESGIIDGYVSEKPEGVSAMAANKNFAFLQFAEGQSFTTSPDDTLLAIGIKKENTALLNDVNKILAGIPDEQRTQIMDKAIKNQPASK